MNAARAVAREASGSDGWKAADGPRCRGADRGAGTGALLPQPVANTGQQLRVVVQIIK